MMDLIGISASQYVMILITLVIAYVIFGIAGFGSALIASPVLALYLPVIKIVPVLALIDLCAAMVNVRQNGKKADWTELRRLIPLMLIGSGMGATLLFNVKADILLLFLGLFVMGYASYALFIRKKQPQFSPYAVIPFGSIGGIFSALFGSGGFIYAIYFSGRIQDKDTLRMTQTTIIGLSTLTRVVLFAAAGVYFDASYLWLALLLAPGMLIGNWLGKKMTLSMNRQQFLKIVNMIVLCSGGVLIARYFYH